MSYRCLMIVNPARIRCKNEQLLIETEEVHSVPIEDISAIVLESRQSTITTAALAALAQNGVVTFWCDETHSAVWYLAAICTAQPPVGRAALADGTDTADEKADVAASRDGKNQKPGGMLGPVRQNTGGGVPVWPCQGGDERR